MRSIHRAALLAVFAMPLGVAAGQPERGQPEQGQPGQGPPSAGQPNPAYRDGTGNDQIERLNSGQLDRNYRGPWYEPDGRPAPPPGVASPYAAGPPGSWGGGAYPPPAYPSPVYSQPAYPQGIYPPRLPPPAGG